MPKLMIIILLFSFQASVLSQPTDCDPEKTNHKYLYDAVTYENAGAHYLAIETASCGLELYPQYSDLYLLRGNNYRSIGEFDAALQDLQASINLDPKRTYIFFTIGMIYSEKREYEKAIEYYYRYIETTEDVTPAVLLSLGSDYTALGKETDAIDAFDRYIEYEPTDAIGYAEKGYALKAFGENTLANETFRTARSVYRNAGAIYVYGAQHVLKRDDFQTALESLNKAIQLSPHLSGPYVLRSIIYLSQHKTQLAQADCEQVQAINAASQYHYLCSAIMNIAHNDWPAALEQIDLVIQADEDNAAYYGIRGYIKVHLEEFDAAIVDLEAAIKIDPYYALAYLLLGNIYEARKQFDEAIDNYLYCLKLKGGKSRNPLMADHIDQLQEANPNLDLLTFSSYDLIIGILDYPIFAGELALEQGVV